MLKRWLLWWRTRVCEATLAGVEDATDAIDDGPLGERLRKLLAGGAEGNHLPEPTEPGEADGKAAETATGRRSRK